MALLTPPIEDQRASDDSAALETCASIRARTAGMAPITDDNMGEEWRFLLQNDPALDRLHRLFRL